MVYQTTLFNAFTGITPVEKSAVVRFLCEHTENTTSHNVVEAVEYAVKHKPSFGGFVLIAKKGKQIVAAVVANCTGMEGYNPKNIFVFVSFHKKHRNDEALVKQLMQKAIRYADGEIALHVEPDNPALKMYQKMGFKAQYLELRFNKAEASAPV